MLSFIDFVVIKLNNVSPHYSNGLIVSSTKIPFFGITLQVLCIFVNVVVSERMPYAQIEKSGDNKLVVGQIQKEITDMLEKVFSTISIVWMHNVAKEFIKERLLILEIVWRYFVQHNHTLSSEQSGISHLKTVPRVVRCQLLLRAHTLFYPIRKNIIHAYFGVVEWNVPRTTSHITLRTLEAVFHLVLT